MPFKSLSTKELLLSPVDPDFFNFERAENGEKKLHYGQFKNGKKYFRTSFEAEVASDTVMVSAFEKPAFSLPVSVENDDIQDLFTSLETAIVSKIPEDQAENWTTTPVIKDGGKIFLKLKYSDPKSLTAKFASNVIFNLKKPLDAKIFLGQLVVITGNLGYYYDFEKKVCGAVFTVTELEFEL